MMNNYYTFEYCGRAIVFSLAKNNDYLQKIILQTSNFYEIDLLEEIGRLPLSEGIICDIGANIGNHTLYFSLILNRKVYAFEPLPIAYDILVKNIQLNFLENKVRLFNIALGSGRSSGKMKINEENIGGSKLVEIPSGDTIIDSLDNVLKGEIPVSLIKIDTEGYENEILRGALNTIRKWKPIVVVEAINFINFLDTYSILKDLNYSPLGEKAKTTTIIFVPNEFFSKNNLITYLIRKDIELSRRRIQGQNDKLVKKITTISNNIEEITCKIDSSKNDELINNIKDQIINKIDNSKNDELINNIKDQIINKIDSSKNDKLIADITNKIKDLKKLQNYNSDLLREIVNKNDIEHNKILSTEFSSTKNYFNNLCHFNQNLLVKLEEIYRSKTWRYTIFIRTILNGFKPIESFDEYKKKTLRKYNYPVIKDNITLSLQKIEHSLLKVKLKSNSSINTDNVLRLENKQRYLVNNSSFKIEKTFIGIAAIPPRKSSLEKTISSLVHQADEIGVYLNGWETIPEYLKNPKIKLVRSQDHGDIGDAGKFYWVDNFEGYYFTCDDDIIYPWDYIKRTIEKIKKYQFKAVIGWHGSLIVEPFENYYDKNSRKVFTFSSNRPEDMYVHILGTGTVGFHTSTIKVRLTDFTKPNMADVFFALLGQNQNVPFILTEHKAKEMLSVEDVQGDSINKHGINNIDSKKNTKEFQNKLVKNISWRLFNTDRLKVLLLGRFDTFIKGGIHKSNHLIKSALEELGHEAFSFDSQSKEVAIEKGIDVAVVYPGDPDRPDFEHAEKKLQFIREADIPIIINLSYNTNPKRTRQIVKRIKTYNKNTNLSPVFLMTFTDVALTDKELSDIKDYIVPMPKTIVNDISRNPVLPTYSEREGIVLGDATKLMNVEITGDDISSWISACKNLLPHVNFYAIKHYGGNYDIPSVETVPYMKEGFLDWISKRRIFVCLNTITTFEMTPTEAQIVGTPVVYRPMAQSLSEYIGRSGISITSPNEFAQICSWLYNDQFAWNKYSELSIKNSKTNILSSLSIGLESTLRKVIFKSRYQSFKGSADEEIESEK